MLSMCTQIVRLSGKPSNCSQWRCLSPSVALNRADGFRAKLIHVSGALNYLDAAIQDLMMPCDVVVFQRNVISPEAFNTMQYWQGMGKPVVVDLDDAYWMLPWSNPAHKFWFEKMFQTPAGPAEKGGAYKMLEEGLRISDGLVAPNRLLLRDFEYCTGGKSYYLQNFAERDWWEDLPDRESLKAQKDLTGKIVIGWGGSVSHYDSWWGSGLRDAAERVTLRHPEVVWMICGNDPRIFDQLPVPLRNKYRQSGVPPKEWPVVVSHFDIGVAPLFGPYDQRRSWIKPLEYMLAGAPWVCQQGEPYADFDGLGLGYCIPPTANDWEDALEHIIENLEEEQANAKQRITYARNFYADNQIDTYRTVYESVRTNFSDSRGSLPGILRIEPSATGQPGLPRNLAGKPADGERGAGGQGADL